MDKVRIFRENDKHLIKIGVIMLIEEKDNLTISLLKKYAELFAWFFIDMLGLDSIVVDPKLTTSLLVKLVK